MVATERRITRASERIKDQTTVAMDFRADHDRRRADPLPLRDARQKRFDFMWEILSEGMLGFVVMIDSTRPETFREARRILDTFRSYSPVPYIVAANKQDLPDAWPVEICALCYGSSRASRSSRA